MDRVQVVKRESAALGGQDVDSSPWPEPIKPQEDACEMAGVYLQDAGNRDETTLIYRAGDDMLFKDKNNTGGYTLTQLAEIGSTIALHKLIILTTGAVVYDTLGEIVHKVSP